MTVLFQFLGHHELLLLFVVVSLGLILGRLEIAGTKLGVAGVLFAGLGLSALAGREQPLRLTTELRDLGLVLFVYAVGLWSGPGFFAAFRRGAVRLNLAVVAALMLGALLSVFGGQLLGLDRGHIAGVFTGGLTNTPALAAAGDRLKGTPFAQHAALAYSVCYPFGVFGALLSLRLFALWQKKQLTEERSRGLAAPDTELKTANFEITNPEIIGHPIGELRVRDKIGVVLSRLRRGAELLVPNKYTVLLAGDVITGVGTQLALANAVPYFGKTSSEQLEVQRGSVDARRIIVSRRALVGRSLRDLDLDVLFGAQVTRLRRADLDLLPSPDLRLELGDRLRVVAPVDKLSEVSRFFGDSARALADIDFLALAVGISAGLLLARLPLPFPGVELKLGLAGGPLLVSLILGRLGRSGPLLWSISYEASSALRDLGLLLFLAGVGVSAGGQLGEVFSGVGLRMLLLGAAVTLVTGLVALVLLRSFGRGSAIGTMGATSGMQTQPAALATAHELAGRSEDTYVFYAIVYPVAMIGKILLAQLIATFA